MSNCLQRYPHLAALSPNPYRLLEDSYATLAPYQHHAFALARDHAIHELELLRRDLPDLSDEEIQRRRQKTTRLLTKLAPGRGTAVSAIQHTDGHVYTDPAHMASALRDRWQGIFTSKPTCAITRQRWIQHHIDTSLATPLSQDQGQAKRVDFVRALDMSNNCARS